MVIYLAGESEEQELRLDELTPRQIVAELDKHVVGQNAAKRAVAIALRNRVRRKKLPPDLAADVIPKNIIMIGSTGVGKTEIARRLARMSNSPFLKVEASKFTEVGYVGRDVESMIRDLTEISVDMVRQEKIEEIADKAELNVEERILDILLPPPKSSSGGPLFDFDSGETSAPVLVPDPEPKDENFARTREKLRSQLRSGKLDNRLVEMEVREKNFPTIEFAGPMGVEGTTVNTRYGMVRTDHILFVAAGAFHVSKPSDLIPELQGRFPIRVELESLTIEDFKRILVEPKNSLVKQYLALMETEGVKLEFTPDAIDAVANYAARVNQQTEDIGARRLHTIMERLLDEISFEGPDLEPKNKTIDAAYD